MFSKQSKYSTTDSFWRNSLNQGVLVLTGASSDNASMASFNANNIQFKFPNGAVALRDVNVSEESGKLVGLMGASGAGKTTLLQILGTLDHVSNPNDAKLTINNICINKLNEKELAKFIITPTIDKLSFS